MRFTPWSPLRDTGLPTAHPVVTYATSYLIPRFCCSHSINEDTHIQTSTNSSNPHNTKMLDFPLCSAGFKSQAFRSVGAGLPLKVRHIYSTNHRKDFWDWSQVPWEGHPSPWSWVGGWLTIPAGWPSTSLFLFGQGRARTARNQGSGLARPRGCGWEWSRGGAPRPGSPAHLEASGAGAWSQPGR